MKRIIFILCLLPIFGLSSFAQLSQKEAANKKIKTVEEWETDLRVRKPKAIQESYSSYDLAGNLLEIIERDNTGVITLHEKYKYDKDGNKTEETQLNSEGEIKKRHVYEFQNGLRISRKTYNKDGQIIGEKKYVYKYHDK
jgi:YD repeat-containing protein